MTTPKDSSSDLHGDSSQMPEPERRVERLLGLLIVGLMLLNFPLLSIFSVSAYFCGIPVLYFYLFSIWFLIIGVTAFVLRSRPSVSEKSSDSQDFREP
ncbi:MAG: hypothetical protein Q8K68_10335 [Nitrospirota bacterium]|nr:hypothetical protein [Nitrospirota bacterium]